MFGGIKPHGFTIIEVLIFLAVSGLLFLSAISLISGQQGNTDYKQSSHTMESTLQTLSTDVQNGYYSYFNGSHGFGCILQNNVPYTTVGALNQGSNFGCTFIGKVIQFAPSDQPGGQQYNQFVVYTIIGSQYQQTSSTIPPLTPVTDFIQANPTAVAQDASFPSQNCLSYASCTYYATVYTVPSGVKISEVNGHHSAGQIIYTSLIGFFNTFPSLTANNSLVNGSKQVELVPIPLATSNSQAQEFVPTSTAVADINGLQDFLDSSGNPTGNVWTCPPPSKICGGGPQIAVNNGVTICMQDNYNSNQYALITIGSSGGSTGALNIQLQTVPTSANQCPTGV